MTIFNVAPDLIHLGLEPWRDGRSIFDGKRPPEQHLAMILSSLVAELKAAHLQIRELEQRTKDEATAYASLAKTYEEVKAAAADQINSANRLINEMKPVFDAAVALGDLLHMVDDYDDPKDEWARLDKAIKATTSGKRVEPAWKCVCGSEWPMRAGYHEGPHGATKCPMT